MNVSFIKENHNVIGISVRKKNGKSQKEKESSSKYNEFPWKVNESTRNRMTAARYNESSRKEIRVTR